MSSVYNPVPEPTPPPGPDFSQPPALVENPPWTGWDVFWIAVITLFSIVFCIFCTTWIAQRLFYRQLTVIDVAKLPLVTVAAQLVAYMVVLVFMISIVEGQRGERFWPAIRWNWPARPWLFLAGGVILSIGLQAFAQLLPMPKELPIDSYFKTAAEAWALSIFGVTLAPLMEELFFRGFLYPVLARRLGLPLAVVLTSASFGLIHAPQLGRAWGPVLVVSLVGVALTLTRAWTKSVASSLLMHITYNGTLSVLLFVGSDGFRHLEKLNQ